MANTKNQNAGAQNKGPANKPNDPQGQQKPEDQSSTDSANSDGNDAGQSQDASSQSKGDPTNTSQPPQNSPKGQKPATSENNGDTNAQTSEEQKPAAQSTKRKVVTFLRPFGRYTRGDIAGFEPNEAERLVKKRVAVEGTKLPAQTDNQDDEPKA